MLKKVIALSTAAMILLTPMSASAASWREVVDGLKTKGSYTDGKLTATRDGNDYTFTGGEIEEAHISPYYPYDLNVNGKIYFNGVQMDKLDIVTKDGKFFVVLDKNTKVGEVLAYADEKGEAILVNEGTIGRGKIPDVQIEVNTHLTNKGTLVAGKTTYWPTEDEVKEVSNVAATVSNATKTRTQEEAEKLVDRMFSFETPGTYNVLVTLYGEDENGDTQVKYFIVTRTVSEDEGPSEEEIRHDMEMKRQAEAVGGVYGSPYWIKQLYLGYHSYNLRLLIDGQPVTMRERLNWNADKSKGISLRVNTVAPEKLTMRFDEKVLEVFERTNITTVTLLDKNGAAVMQYNVSDLRAAYDQYGLNDADQLVVGGVDDDVMKIGADGQLVPVE